MIKDLLVVIFFWSARAHNLTFAFLQPQKHENCTPNVMVFRSCCQQRWVM